MFLTSPTRPFPTNGSLSLSCPREISSSAVEAEVEDEEQLSWVTDRAENGAAELERQRAEILRPVDDESRLLSEQRDIIKKQAAQDLGELDQLNTEIQRKLDDELARLEELEERARRRHTEKVAHLRQTIDKAKKKTGIEGQEEVKTPQNGQK